MFDHALKLDQLLDGTLLLVVELAEVIHCGIEGSVRLDIGASLGKHNEFVFIFISSL